MVEKRDETRLTREVLRPQKPQTGLGVMIVAATAMFFAVASSAFVLRARMARCDHQVATPPPGAVQRPAPAEPATIAEPQCGEPVYKLDPAGQPTSVVFRTCDPEQTVELAPTGERAESIEVGEVVVE